MEATLTVTLHKFAVPTFAVEFANGKHREGHAFGVTLGPGFVPVREQHLLLLVQTPTPEKTVGFDLLAADAVALTADRGGFTGPVKFTGHTVALEALEKVLRAVQV